MCLSDGRVGCAPLLRWKPLLPDLRLANQGPTNEVFSCDLFIRRSIYVAKCNQSVVRCVRDPCSDGLVVHWAGPARGWPFYLKRESFWVSGNRSSMKYQFRTRVGLLTIAPHPRLTKLVQLWLGSFLLGSFNSAHLAAEALKTGKTGCPAIDKLPPEDRPAQLTDWTHATGD